MITFRIWITIFIFTEKKYSSHDDVTIKTAINKHVFCCSFCPSGEQNVFVSHVCLLSQH